MKKTYIIPETLVVHMDATMPIATSPGVGLDQEGSVEASEIEVKGQPSYNAWDDDWSE